MPIPNLTPQLYSSDFDRFEDSLLRHAYFNIKKIKNIYRFLSKYQLL